MRVLRRPAGEGGGQGPLRYRPAGDVVGRAHVLVDGAPQPGTALTLSHWPGTPTPLTLQADLSTESAVLARRRRALPRGVTEVTTDHPDEDATAAVAVLTASELTASRAALLIEVARIGDFGVVRDRRAAQVAFALATVLDPVRTPVGDATGGARSAPDVTGALVGAGLAVLDDMAADPDRRRELWAPELAAFDAAVAAVADGRVLLTEEPARDLAIVRPGPGGWPPAARWGDDPVHRAAVHTATGCLRVATIDEGTTTVRYRYESWVRLAIAPPALRIDLTMLAAELDVLEGGGTVTGAGGGGAAPGAATGAGGPSGHLGRWRFDGVGALTPRLRWDGTAPSSLDPEVVLERLRRYLDERAGLPPAWNPYAGAPGAGR